MSKLRKWLTGAEVIGRLDISRLDLLELALNGRLLAHDPDTGEELKIAHRFLSSSFGRMKVKRPQDNFILKRADRELPPEELEKMCFGVPQVEALEKNKQKTNPWNEDKRDTVRIETPLFDNLREYGPSPLEVLCEKTRLMEESLMAEYYDTSDQIDAIISKALPEIDEAYNVALEEGGGWSSKGGPEQRQAAVLAWFGQNEARLTWLKKSYLEDAALYHGGGGRAKRNFRVRLIVKIGEETPRQEITSQEYFDSLFSLQKYGPSPLEAMNEIISLREEVLQSLFGGEDWFKSYFHMNIPDFRNDDPQNRIDAIISKAILEIDEAYNVIKQDGGGWSSRKGGPDQRQTAVLAWLSQNEARLTYLKKSYLEDPALYNDGGGQQKRNFRNRLIKKVVKENSHQKITSQEIIDYLSRLKK